MFLCRHLRNDQKLVALKLIKQDYLAKKVESMDSVMQEISIHKNLDHHNINHLIDYGTEGEIVKPSGRVISNLVFIMMEYVAGGTFYDMCEKFAGMGETRSRFFMHQLVDAIGYLHNNEVVHRDLKLENILVNDNMDLKIADFGFATD